MRYRATDAMEIATQATESALSGSDEGRVVVTVLDGMLREFDAVAQDAELALDALQAAVEARSVR